MLLKHTLVHWVVAEFAAQKASWESLFEFDDQKLDSKLLECIKSRRCVHVLIEELGDRFGKRVVDNLRPLQQISRFCGELIEGFTSKIGAKFALAVDEESFGRMSEVDFRIQSLDGKIIAPLSILDRFKKLDSLLRVPHNPVAIYSLFERLQFPRKNLT
jgi:hypothetical protein